MRSFIIFCLLYLFSVKSLYAQQIKSNGRSDSLRSLFKINAGLESGLLWEQKIKDKSVVTIGSGISIARQSDDLYKTKAPLIFLPVTYAEYRNYYNLKKRLKTNKEIVNNAADFLFGKIETFYAVKRQNYFGLLFIQGWGLQRAISKRLSIDGHIGLIEHLYFDKPPHGRFNYIKFEPDIEFSISYIIN